MAPTGGGCRQLAYIVLLWVFILVFDMAHAQGFAAPKNTQSQYSSSTVGLSAVSYQATGPARHSALAVGLEELVLPHHLVAVALNACEAQVSKKRCMQQADRKLSQQCLSQEHGPTHFVCQVLLGTWGADCQTMDCPTPALHCNVHIRIARLVVPITKTTISIYLTHGVLSQAADSISWCFCRPCYMKSCTT